MKSHTEYLTFNVPARMDFVNITCQIEEIVTTEAAVRGFWTLWRQMVSL